MEYTLRERGIQIIGGDLKIIDEKIFDEELFEYRIVDREELIDDLIRWISENSRDKELMKEDLKMLMQWSDDYIFSSISTNDYIGEHSSNFEETCEQLIEINYKLHPARNWKHEVEELLQKIEDKIEELPYQGDVCEDSQKICLTQALQELWHNVNGVTDADFVELNDEEE